MAFEFPTTINATKSADKQVFTLEAYSFDEVLEGYITTISSTFIPGTLLTLHNSAGFPIGSGIVIRNGASGLLHVASGDITQVRFYSATNWFVPKTLGYRILSYESLIQADGERSVMEIAADTSLSHTPGFMRWSLALNGVLLADGTDSLVPSQCYLELENYKWPAGDYIISACIYSKDLTALSRDDLLLVLTEPSLHLRAGTKEDKIEPLRLL